MPDPINCATIASLLQVVPCCMGRRQRPPAWRVLQAFAACEVAMQHGASSTRTGQLGEAGRTICCGHRAGAAEGMPAQSLSLTGGTSLVVLDLVCCPDGFLHCRCRLRIRSSFWRQLHRPSATMRHWPPQAPCILLRFCCSQCEQCRKTPGVQVWHLGGPSGAAGRCRD